MFLYHVLAGKGIDLHLTADGATVIASRSLDGSGFELLDVVGGRIPDLATLLGALGLEPTRVEACFPADRLNWTGTPVSSGREDALMIRGSLPGLEGQALMLPPTATF
jgi:hypothetical protein